MVERARWRAIGVLPVCPFGEALTQLFGWFHPKNTKARRNYNGGGAGQGDFCL